MCKTRRDGKQAKGNKQRRNEGNAPFNIEEISFVLQEETSDLFEHTVWHCFSGEE
jgi:hypothetical protein